MRLLDLQLQAVGPFTGAMLDLRGGNRGLHLIYGANEAGKSSTLRALRYLLFGFPVQLTDDFLHPYAQLRVGATLESDAGETLEIVRRKAAKQSLRGADDTAVIEEAELRRFLGNIDAGLFGTFFGIDHPQLVDGGRSIVEGRGDVGGVLFSAAGVGDLNAVQKTLDKECDELFRPQAKNPKLNALFAQLREAEKRVAELSLAPKEWEDHRDKLAELQKKKQAVDAELAEQRRQRARLDRVQRALRLLPDRDRWQDEAARLADAVLLPEDFRDRRQKLQQAVAVEQTKRQRAREAVEQCEDQLESLERPATLLAQRENIGQAAGRLSEYLGAVRDRPGLERRLHEHDAAARAALEELDRSLTPDEAAALKLTSAQRTRIHALSTRYQKMLTQEESGAEAVSVLAARLDEARRHLETLPAERNVAGLQSALQTVARLADLEERRDEARRECERAAAQVEADALTVAASLRDAKPTPSATEEASDSNDERDADLATPSPPGFGGGEGRGEGGERSSSLASAEATRALADPSHHSPPHPRPLSPAAGERGVRILALALPSMESVERKEQEFAASEQELRTLRARLQEREAEWREATAALDAMERACDVPSEDELNRLRALRDRAWQLIRPCVEGNPPDAPVIDGFRVEAGRDGGLADIFHTLLEEADATADRLRREADQIARHAQLVARMKTLQGEIYRHTRQLADAEARRDGLLAEWRSLWRPSRIDPETPREMQAFLRRHADLVRRGHAVDELRAKADALAARCRESEALLRQRLSESNVAPPESAGLAELIALAEKTIAAASELSLSRAEAQRNIQRIERELRGPNGAEQRQAAAREELAAWEQDWNAAVAGLPLSAGVTPDVAAEELDRLTQARQALQQAADLRSRLTRIDEACRSFEGTVRSLCGQVDPALASLPVEQAAAALTARLADALQVEERERVLRQKRDEEQRRGEESDRRLAELDSQLATLMCEARCASADELAQAEERSAARRRAEEKLAACEAQLRELGGGTPLDEFLAECRTFDADVLGADVARLDAEIEEQNRRLTDELGEAIGAEKKVLDQMDSSGQAAEAAVRVADLTAKIAAEAEEFARLSLARVVLKKGIERYRERHQGPILSRASAIFASLTCGSFSGLREDYGENGRPMLVGIRSSTGQPVTVDRMSDGTADQIYLAVRLAWLEEFLGKHESLPFIVDDVLIRFDDARAIETLRALADLSRKTQVLFFTHHKHLLDLARERLPKDVLFTHDLPGSDAPSVVPPPHALAAASSSPAKREPRRSKSLLDLD